VGAEAQAGQRHGTVLPGVTWTGGLLGGVLAATLGALDDTSIPFYVAAVSAGVFPTLWAWMLFDRFHPPGS